MKNNEEKQSGKFDPKEIELISKNGTEIRNKEAYELYKKLEAHPILNKKKIIKASNGEEFNLNVRRNIIEIKIKHLPQEDRERILKAKKISEQIRVKMMGALRKAYGAHAQKQENGIVINHPLDVRKEEITELFGRMFTVKEVHAAVVEKFKIKCSIDIIKAFRIKHLQEIQAKTEQFKRDFTDVRLAIKRGRLEELVWLYNSRKRIYELNQRGDDHRLLLTTIEAIRKEAEGDTLRIEGGININVDTLISNHIQQEIQQTLPLREIILARIAASSNVPIKIFLGQLEKSWYNKVFSAEKGEYINFEEIKRPTNEAYDFDQIAAIQKQREQNKPIEIKEALSKEMLNSKDKVQAISLKEALLKKLKQQENEMNYVKGTINNQVTE